MTHLILFGLSLASHALAACSRAALQDATSAYVKAIAAGQPGLLSLGSNATYAENDVSLDIKQGVLSQAITVDFTRSLHDSVECATFTEITAASSKHPYVIHTRMLVDDAKITAIESVVTDAGDWAFNATGHRTSIRAVYIPILADSRHTPNRRIIADIVG